MHLIASFQIVSQYSVAPSQKPIYIELHSGSVFNGFQNSIRRMLRKGIWNGPQLPEEICMPFYIVSREVIHKSKHMQFNGTNYELEIYKNC